MVPNTKTPAQWRRFTTARDRLERFLSRRGYDVISTPLLESTELFLRKSGGELAAQMYSFTDPAGRRVSLRPEFTSSVVNAVVDGSLTGPFPQRWQYYGPVFRYDGPGNETDRAGGLEFQQLGAELLGADGAQADAEVIALAAQGLTALGVRGHGIRIGHMGVVNALLDSLGLSERARVFTLNALGSMRSGDEAMEDVRRRATELGLLAGEHTRALAELARRLDPEDAEGMVEGFLAQGVSGLSGQRTPEEIFRRYLKKLKEAGVPEIVERALRFSAELVSLSGTPAKVRPKLGKLLGDFDLDESLLGPLDELLAALNLYDLKDVSVVVDLGMARGLAYYTGVVFELTHPKIAGVPGLGGGGRYDGLTRALGGSAELPALGYAYTLEQVIGLLPNDFGTDEDVGEARVLVVASPGAMAEAVSTAERLRVQGIPAELDLARRSDTEAAKYAKQRGIQTVMRVGQDGNVAERTI